MKLLEDIRRCRHCAPLLPHEPKPVLNFSPRSRILLAGQAPGRKVHASGLPWDDASGERLRDWLGVSAEEFYNPEKFAVVPMGFCYPGKGSSGDLPPRPECAALWLEKILRSLKHRELTILVGQYAQAYFLREGQKATLTENVRSFEEYLPHFLVMPHPSPRNNIWLKKNPWFERRNLPFMRKIVREHLV